ncbi:MAG: hypothetical protein VX737_00410 [Pseudomonadota bacterium]|nr:hypothetical protein [Pseudomonadota bacterium]
MTCRLSENRELMFSSVPAQEMPVPRATGPVPEELESVTTRASSSTLGSNKMKMVKCSQKWQLNQFFTFASEPSQPEMQDHGKTTVTCRLSENRELMFSSVPAQEMPVPRATGPVPEELESVTNRASSPALRG